MKDLHINKNNMMIVSPDEGAVQRNIYYSSVLSLDMGMFYKRRDYTQVVAGAIPSSPMSIWALRWKART